MTGGLPRKLDVRDVYLEDLNLGSGTFPSAYIPPIKTTYWQGKMPACGAHAGAYLKTIQDKGEYSPRYLWIQIKQIDGYPLDAGTDMRSIFKALQKKGICSASLLPNDVSLTLEEYSDVSKVTTEMVDDALPNEITAYAFLRDTSFNSIKEAIAQHKAVTLLLWAGEDWWGKKMPMPIKKKYGHFVEAVGYDEDFIYVLDSSDKGNYIKQLSLAWEPYIREAGTTVDADNEVIKKLVDRRRALQRIVSLFQKVIELTKIVKWRALVKVD